jgi:zinc finger BED domain-containing protein 1 (E3 SUMO-protein ligase ZBED1)
MSDVWKFITKLDGGKKCKCNLCSKTLAYCGGTTNLREHLVNQHALEYNKTSTTGNKQTLMTSFVRGTCDSARSGKITNLIADLICRDLRPISIVNGGGFRDLLQYLEPGYKIPSHTHMASIIAQKHEVGIEKLKVILSKYSPLALTTDSWTSCGLDSYVTVTAHFIDEDWKMVSCIMATRSMEEKHSAENLANRLFSTVVTDYKLEKSNICAIIHDNAANMKRMNELLLNEMECPTWSSIPCTAHTTAGNKCRTFYQHSSAPHGSLS